MAAELLVAFADRLRTFEQLDHEETSELVSDLLDELVAGENTTPAPTGLAARARLLRTRAVVIEGCSDPALCPLQIADAVGVSVRSLHDLARSQGTTLMGLVRRYRLEGIHDELTNPTMSATSIDIISRRWGYKAHAHMTRDFRKAYGCNPNSLRRR